jgi:O-antigen/teichoic acid export membrane protein
MTLRRPIMALRSSIVGSPLIRRFLSSAYWSVLGSIGSNGVSLVMTMMVARLLAKEAFGEYVALQTTITMMSAFSWYGVGFTATRFAAELHRRDPARLGRILGLSELIVFVVGLVASATLAAASGWLARTAFHAPDLGPRLALVSAATLLSSLDGIQRSVLVGLSEMRAFAFGASVGALAAFPLMVGLTYVYGLDGAAAGIVATALVNCVISRAQLRNSLRHHDIHPRLSGALAEKYTLLHFALPGLLLGLAPSIAQWIVQSMLARASTYGEMAILGVALQWFHVVNFLPATMSRAVMPLLTDVVADKNHGSSSRVLLAGIAASLLTAIPVALLGTLLSPYIMASYGAQFVSGTVVVMIAMGVAVLHAAQYSVQQLIAARAQMWVGIAMNAVQASIFVGAAYFLVAQGARGAMTAFAIAYVAQTTWAGFYAWAFLRRGAGAATGQAGALS